MGLHADGILRLAGLQSEFEVIDEKIFRNEQKVVYVLGRKSPRGICSHCGSNDTGVHSQDKVLLRELPAFGYQVFWQFKRYTLRCHNCQRIGVEHHWLFRPRKHFTWRFECQISRMCEQMTNVAVATLEKIADTTVYKIDFELLSLRIERQTLPAVGPHYSMDEVYFHYFKDSDPRAKSKFITNLLDLKHKRIITNSPGRSISSAKACILTALTEEDMAKAESFATDMHEPFHAAIRDLCPNAVVVLDRFHIMKQFNEVMNEFRIHQMNLSLDDEFKQLMRGKYKWILMRNPDSLSHKDRLHLDELKKLNERIVEACLIRAHFVSFFDAKDEAEGKERWELLIAIVKQADIAQFNKFFLHNLKKWLPLIFNYFKHKTTSAIIEAVNHKIKAVKWAAYGYRNLRYFQLKILQRVGFLNSKFAPLPERTH
jgi:transposase